MLENFIESIAGKDGINRAQLQSQLSQCLRWGLLMHRDAAQVSFMQY